MILSECMDFAGYKTDPAYVAEYVISAPRDNWYRVTFQNETDSSTFVHLGVQMDLGEVVAYKDEDKTALDTMGCSVGNRTLL